MNFFRKKLTPEQEQKCASIDMFLETIEILNTALEAKNHDKAHEAVTILLMQCMTTFGQNHPVTQQFFPVMDTIQRRINSMELEAALRQSKLFEKQLNEVKQIALGKK